MKYYYVRSEGRIYHGDVPPDGEELEAGRGAMFLQAQERRDAALEAGNEALAATLEINQAAIEAAIVSEDGEAFRRRVSRRAWRNAKLAASDWTQMPDALADKPEVKALWAQYRQQLRDLDMDGTDYPEPPQ